ncbi:HD domain-containing protein [Clostridium sp. P21]|uniref:HD domain-containing protein n=1 Tax=Clostridium muellerianum TaxID=2716538 RepID=A0A7Y0EK05_9CLOT|nr:HD domain-containing protein [Clostridium muellerianum]NMM64792.1 HD domain-containing protein [Clostridium muellerianum]
MDKINSILNNEEFKEYIKKNEGYEKGRKFCKHNLQHFLDVARIAYILVLENGLNISKDIIYGTALLHDIGRWLEYKENVDHEIASSKLAKEILEVSRYNDEEIKIIMDTILNHRKEGNEESSFSYVFYLSDKASRNCFYCKAIDECKWLDEKKNYNIKY